MQIYYLVLLTLLTPSYLLWAGTQHGKGHGLLPLSKGRKGARGNGGYSLHEWMPSSAFMSRTLGAKLSFFTHDLEAEVLIFQHQDRPHFNILSTFNVRIVRIQLLIDLNAQNMTHIIL